MKPTPDLFNLVKSLTKNEKRQVTLFLASGFYKNNKNSLVLFKAVARQEQFDEAALKRQAGKVIAKRFSAEKNKLFDLVLESLMFLYRDAMPERRVMRARLRSGILFSKGLRAHGWRYFQKARAMAEEYETFPQQLLLAYQENHETRLGSAEEIHFTEMYHERDKQLIQSMSDDLVLHTLFTGLIDLQKRYGTEMKNAEAALERVMQHPLVDPSRKLVSFSSEMSRLEIRALYYSMKNNHREAHHCFREQVALIEKSKTSIDQHYNRYCNALSNQLMQAVLMREYDGVAVLAQKLKKVNEGILNYFTYDIAYNEFIGIALYELIAYKNRVDKTKGVALLSQMEKQFAHYRPQIRDVLVVAILFLFGTYHFYLGNLKKALQHFNDLVDSTDTAVAQNFHCMARLVKLLLHYDLGHYDLLPSLCQSTMRLLKKNNRLGVFEKELISFCQKSAEGENKSALKLFLSSAKKHAPGYYSYGAWSDFEFEEWVVRKTK